MSQSEAEKNLATIRDLMEKAAIYKQALAPIFMMTGIVGVLYSIAACSMNMKSAEGFLMCWMAVAVAIVISAVIVMQRQAKRQGEPFLAGPVVRLIRSLLPPLFVGACLGSLQVFRSVTSTAMIVALWIMLYGCAQISASMVVLRGLKVLGWIFVIVGIGAALFLSGRPETSIQHLHMIMGASFGGLHIGYSIYLYIVEKR